MRDLLPALTLCLAWIGGVLLIMWRQRTLERRRAERARRRRILRYLATTDPVSNDWAAWDAGGPGTTDTDWAAERDAEERRAAINVVPLDTYSRKAQP